MLLLKLRHVINQKENDNKISTCNFMPGRVERHTGKLLNEFTKSETVLK